MERPVVGRGEVCNLQCTHKLWCKTLALDRQGGDGPAETCVVGVAFLMERIRLVQTTNNTDGRFHEYFFSF